MAIYLNSFMSLARCPLCNNGQNVSWSQEAPLKPTHTHQWQPCIASWKIMLWIYLPQIDNMRSEHTFSWNLGQASNSVWILNYVCHLMSPTLGKGWNPIMQPYKHNLLFHWISVQYWWNLLLVSAFFMVLMSTTFQRICISNVAIM